jgi:hypothetical protein
MQPLGKNTAAEFGKKIARTLGLSDPERYTSHFSKRMSLSYLAEANLSAVQIVGFSGK